MEVCSKYVWNRPKKESEIESVGSLKKANFFRKRGFQRQKMISFLLGIAVFFFLCVECVASVACFMVSVVSSCFSDVAL